MWRCLQALPRRLAESWMQLAGAVRQLLPTADNLRELALCLRPDRRSFSCLRDYQRNLAPQRRRLLFNLFVALAITVLLNALDFSPEFVEEDSWFDWVIAMRLGKEPKIPAIPLGWIDIDDDTHRDWREPLFVPRNKLARLIRFVLFDGERLRRSDGVRLLVVDIELARRDRSEEEDQPVMEVLQDYADACEQDGPCPSVLLAASLRLEETGLPEQRPSFVDDLVTFHPHLFFWASPLFDKDSDGIIRRWRLWEPVCSNGIPVALPSFQLLGALLLKCGASESDRLYEYLRSLVTGSCGPGGDKIIGCKEPATPGPDICLSAAQLDGPELSFSCDHLSRRILYATSRAVSSTTKTVNPWIRTDSGESRTLVARVPANTVLKTLRCNDRREQSLGDLKGRAVFIGASYYDSRDLHGTPVGPMPGVLILMNSMHSLLQHGEVHEPWLMTRMLLMVVLVFLMSVFFTAWDSFAAKIMASLVVYASLIPITFVLFGSGLWLDFALPLFAVHLNEAFSGVREMLCGD